MTTPQNASAAAGLAGGDQYEIPLGERTLLCRVPTLADVSRLTLLQFRIDRSLEPGAGPEQREDARAAQIELYQQLPAVLGLSPDVRLLPLEVARIVADFFLRSRVPRRPITAEETPPAPGPAVAPSTPGA